MNVLPEIKILESWRKNVSPWIRAIQEKQIESRKLVTDKAVVDAVLSLAPSKVIDIGCGEGWLVRELQSHGISATGIDAVEGLINTAREKGEGVFHVLEYDRISPLTINDKYDLAVCNFSLLGKESVENVFESVSAILKEGGFLLVQTLHPHIACGDAHYANGWREGSWEGFSPDFVDPAPWYFRTLESWVQQFSVNGMKLHFLKEPFNTQTGKVVSLLMAGRVST